jgi:hypothetical protein
MNLVGQALFEARCKYRKKHQWNDEMESFAIYMNRDFYYEALSAKGEQYASVYEWMGKSETFEGVPVYVVNDARHKPFIIVNLKEQQNA